LIALGGTVAMLGLVIGLCAGTTAGNVADMETFAAKYGDGTLPWLLAAVLCACLLVVVGVVVGVVGGLDLRRPGFDPRARLYIVSALGGVAAWLGGVEGLCILATAMNVGDMETFAAKYGNGTQPFLLTAEVCSLLLLAAGVAVAVVAAVAGQGAGGARRAHSS
jgi:hypothetical protein